MSKVMVPIDGSECALRALNHVIRNAQRFQPLTLHLLNVQFPIATGTVRLFIDQATIRQYHQEEGEAMLARARELLSSADVPYETHIKVGRIAETIVASAKELGCDEIVMGSRGSSSTAGHWLGSVATKTLHLASVPVTIIK
ncbi:universal stress protein [Bordetella genomosp. 13]|uniref:UspA domain-containing protein n=1 Tax=Bordetella genomosp. 13 TaxID=463040 RepID=A0A1W6ZC52_9BORD|nr:universal stress protein [Bordetella genomosp. 13]ARP94877.1 hypothetical protein CAL15_11110 [Bordetella genomosp. 13]